MPHSGHCQGVGSLEPLGSFSQHGIPHWLCCVPAEGLIHAIWLVGAVSSLQSGCSGLIPLFWLGELVHWLAHWGLE